MYALLFAAAVASAALPDTAASTPVPDAARLHGKVTDFHGNPLAGVRVTVAEFSRLVLTDQEGNYALVNLPSGTYNVTFALLGFGPQSRRVALGTDDLTLNITLNESLVELPPLQVTASPNASTALTSPQPVSVLGGAKLEADHTANLGQTIDKIPGVTAWTTGAGIGKPVIRGLSANNVLVLANGQRTDTQQWADEHSPNIETSDAERIEVIKGPASVLYGSDAVGGVVNVIPPAIPDAIGTKATVGGKILGAYGTNNINPDGTLMLNGASGGFGFRAALVGRNGDNIVTPVGTLDNTGFSTVDGSIGLGYHAKWGTLTGSYVHRYETLQLMDEDPAATPFQHVTDNRFNVGLVAPTGGASRIEANVGYDSNRRREFEQAGDTEDEVASGLQNGLWTSDVHYHNNPLGPFVGTIGVQGYHNGWDRFGTEKFLPPNQAFGIGVFGFEQADFGHFTLSLGLRYDFRQLDVDEAEVGREDRNRIVPEQTRTYNSVTGNIGGLYHLSEPVALVVNVGRAFRAPSIFELFGYGVHEGVPQFLIGNDSLQNQTSWTTDLALRVQSGHVQLEVGGFYTPIHNFIYSNPTSGLDTNSADPEASGLQEYEVTQGNAVFYGFEAGVDYHPTRWLELEAGGDYTYAQNQVLEQPIPWIAPMRIRYSAKVIGGDGKWYRAPYFSVGASTVLEKVASRVDPNELEPGTPIPGDYTLVNFGVGAQFPVGGQLISLNLDLFNAFNQQYVWFLNRYRNFVEDSRNLGMGRNFMVRMAWTF